MKDMRITVFAMPPLPTNCYIAHSETEALAIDPGGDPTEIIRFLTERGLLLTRILLTHLHSDHTVGAGPLSRAFAAPIFASAKDGWMLDDYLGKGDDDWGIPSVEPFSFQSLAEGDHPLLDSVCTVLETPGHSPGSLCLYFKEAGLVFSGDTLFRRTGGRTDFAGGSVEDLERSLREKLFTLPADTRVFPGHGAAFLLEESLIWRQFHANVAD